AAWRYWPRSAAPYLSVGSLACTRTTQIKFLTQKPHNGPSHLPATMSSTDQGGDENVTFQCFDDDLNGVVRMTGGEWTWCLPKELGHVTIKSSRLRRRQPAGWRVLVMRCSRKRPPRLVRALRLSARLSAMEP